MPLTVCVARTLCVFRLRSLPAACALIILGLCQHFTTMCSNSLLDRNASRPIVWRQLAAFQTQRRRLVNFEWSLRVEGEEGVTVILNDMDEL